MNIGINEKAILVLFVGMKHDLITATLIPAVAAKDNDAGKKK